MLNNCCLWLTGLSGAGKTTIAERLVEQLEALGQPQCNVEHLDGDIVRQTFCKDLGFSKSDRDENVKRISYVAAYLSASRITVCTFISPYKEARARARALCTNFIEVHVDTPLEVCEDRDVKGLYARARAGEIKGFTGIDDPYEAPLNPEIVLKTMRQCPIAALDGEAKLLNRDVDDCVDEILKYLYEH